MNSLHFDQLVILRKHLTLLVELTKCYHPTYLWVTCQGFSQKKERLNNAICAGSYVISLMTGNHRKKITFSRGTEETFLSFHILQTSIFNSCPFLRELRFNSNLFFSLYILLYKFCISYLLLSGVTSWFWVGVSQIDTYRTIHPKPLFLYWFSVWIINPLM